MNSTKGASSRVHPLTWGHTSGGVYVLVFTHMPGESYRWRFWYVLCSCYLFRTLFTPFVNSVYRYKTIWDVVGESILTSRSQNRGWCQWILSANTTCWSKNIYIKEAVGGQTAINQLLPSTSYHAGSGRFNFNRWISKQESYHQISKQTSKLWNYHEVGWSVALRPQKP